MSRFENLDLDQALRLITEGTAGETGTSFYSALVKALAATLNTSGAWVTEYQEEAGRLRSLAFQLNGEWISDYEYALPGTPCEPVIKEAKLVHIPENVAQLFPDDPDLSTFGAVSYVGMPLLDDDGTVLGHLAILDTKPIRACSVSFASSQCARLPNIDACAPKQKFGGARRSSIALSAAPWTPFSNSITTSTSLY